MRRQLTILFAFLISVVTVPPPPVQNKTTIIIYTDDTKTWNEARLVCESLGQKLLDITYYSLYITLGSMALDSPWKDLPVGNGPPKWISLHRRITPLGDEFYSLGCQSLADFNVRYWSDGAPTVPDGDPDSFCVHHETHVDPLTGGGFSSKADYTMANCSEKHQFYCQKEEGPCPFDVITDRHGNTSTDYTPSNDIVIPYTTDDACKQRCFQESSLIVSSNDVTEECWGFTTTSTECILHVVVKPNFFDDGNHYDSTGDALYIKRCFYIEISNTVIDVGDHDSFYPDSTCGTAVMENSTLTTHKVFVYPGTLTWNEGLQTCQHYNQEMLDIDHDDMYSAVQSLITTYPALSVTGGLWLGYHKPDPQNYSSIRVRSDCSTSNVASNWDPAFLPSNDVMNDKLCVVLDINNLLWKPVACNEAHSLVCLDKDTGSVSYDAGVSNTVGDDGVSLGSYDYNYTMCSASCTNWAYQGQDCRAFAHRYSATDGDICHLYFADNFTFYETNVQSTADNFTFYKKLLWTDIGVVSPVTFSDDSIFPYSCCDLSTIDASSECPSDQVPSLEPNIPTSKKVEFFLHTVPQTWNEASRICQSGGGKLMRIDGVSKRHVLENYIDSWQTDGHIAGLLWSGLVLADQDDSCSFRWPNACTVPDWLVFKSGGSDPGSSRFCGALDDSVEHAMKQCNESLQYICERSTNNLCVIDETLVDTNCYMEGAGEYSLGAAGTCDAKCLTETKLEKECFTSIDIDVNTCALLYYVDPFYCKENNDPLAGRTAHFKNCYTEQVITIPTAFTSEITDSSHIPVTDCFQPFVYPHTKDVSRCPSTTTTTTTPIPTTTTTTTTPIPTTTTTTTTTIPTTTTPIATTTTTTTTAATTTTTSPTTTAVLTTTTTFTVAPTSSSTTTSTITSTPPTSVMTSTTSTSFDTSTSTTPAGSPTTTPPVSYTSNRRSIPTPIQVVVPISVASQIVVPLTSLPQTVQDKNLTAPIFLWPCSCNTDYENKMTVEQWTEWFSQTQAIAKNKTSRYQRRLRSAEDARRSSISIGIVAAITLSIFGFLIVLLDAPTVIHNLRHIHDDFRVRVYKAR